MQAIAIAREPLRSLSSSGTLVPVIVISAIQQKGGSGKTTLLVSLAGEFSKDRKVVLLDADPQGSASEWLAEFDGFRTIATEDPVALLAQVEADVVLIDTPSHDADVASRVFPVSDLVLLPISPSALDIRAALPLLRSIRAGKAVSPALVVLCRTDSRTRAPAEARAALEGTGVPVAAAELGSRTAHVEATVEGVPITTYEPNGAAAVEAKDLAREIVAHIRREQKQ